MHHKFAIVDRKVLITGSLNWTTQAIQNNRLIGLCQKSRVALTRPCLKNSVALSSLSQKNRVT